MYRITFGERFIASAGYDALTMELELEFSQTGQVSLFLDVPEEIWYAFKTADYPYKYFQKNIRGKYEEARL